MKKPFSGFVSSGHEWREQKECRSRRPPCPTRARMSHRFVPGERAGEGSRVKSAPRVLQRHAPPYLEEHDAAYLGRGLTPLQA